MRSIAALLMLITAACSAEAVPTDGAPAASDAARVDAATAADATAADAAAADAAAADAAVADAHAADAAVSDAHAADAAAADAAIADAATADAATVTADATVTDAAPPTVTVRVDPGAPRAGAFVVRQRGDLVLDTVQTDATGEVTLVVEPGDTITAGYQDVLDNGSVSHRLVTWQAVEPGDVLSAGDPGRGEVFASVRVRPQAPVESASFYRATSGCNEADVQEQLEPIEYPLHLNCHAVPDQIPVLLAAIDHEGYTIAYAATDYPILDGVCNPYFPTWRTDTFDVTSTVTNLPATAGGWGTTIYVLGAGREPFWPIPMWPTPGSTERVLHLPIGLGRSWLELDGFAEGPGGQAVRVHLLAGVLPAPSTTSFDASQVLPRIDSIAYAGDEAARMSIGWTLDAATNDVDAAIVTATLPTQDGTTVWTIVAGPQTTSVQLPTLPEAMAGYRPTAPPSTTVAVLLADTDAAGVPAYRSFRALLNGGATDFDSLPFRVTAAGAREVRLSQLRVFGAP